MSQKNTAIVSNEEFSEVFGEAGFSKPLSGFDEMFQTVANDVKLMLESGCTLLFSSQDGIKANLGFGPRDAEDVRPHFFEQTQQTQPKDGRKPKTTAAMGVVIRNGSQILVVGYRVMNRPTLSSIVAIYERAKIPGTDITLSDAGFTFAIESRTANKAGTKTQRALALEALGVKIDEESNPVKLAAPTPEPAKPAGPTSLARRLLELAKKHAN